MLHSIPHSDVGARAYPPLPMASSWVRVICCRRLDLLRINRNCHLIYRSEVRDCAFNFASRSVSQKPISSSRTTSFTPTPSPSPRIPANCGLALLPGNATYYLPLQATCPNSSGGQTVSILDLQQCFGDSVRGSFVFTIFMRD